MNLRRIPIVLTFFTVLNMYFPVACMIAPQQCNICLMDKQDDEFVRLSCGHSDCYECLESMVDLSIKEKDTSYLQCSDCKASLSQSDIAKIVNDQGKIDKIAEIATHEYLISQNEVKCCPTPDCQYAFLDESNCKQMVTCPSCSNTYCSGCLIYHSNDVTCQQARDRVDLDSQTSAWLKENTTECPKCKAHIERAGGCLFVQCKFCKHSFCWNCHGTHHEFRCWQPRAQSSYVYVPEGAQLSQENTSISSGSSQAHVHEEQLHDNQPLEQQNQQQEGPAYIYTSDQMQRGVGAYRVPFGTPHHWFMHRVRFRNRTTRLIADGVIRFIQRNSIFGGNDKIGFERSPLRVGNGGQVHEIRITTRMTQEQFQQVLNHANQECF